MSNLDVVYAVWQDLDAFYGKGTYASWKDMMCELCLAVDGKPRLNTLLSALGAEDYTSHENILKMQELSNVFQFVSDNFESLLVQENWSQELYESSKNYTVVLSSILVRNPALLEHNKILEGKKEYIVGLDAYFADPYALNHLVADGMDFTYRELFVDESFFEYTNKVTAAELNRLRTGCVNNDTMSLFIVKCLFKGALAKTASKYQRTIIFRAGTDVKPGDNTFGNETITFVPKKLYGFEYLQGVKKDKLGNQALLLGVV